jgi:NosR/NirI family transcriptional regulator, nitrous oxide reductase regulator
MRTAAALAAFIVGAGLLTVAAQSDIDARLRAQLSSLFPSAAQFSGKSGDPPHYKALGAAAREGAPPVLGYAFWTTELEPLERGYDGPIKMLVGLDPKGMLTGVIVVQHNEPYGNFSIEPPRFAAQFRGKSIRDPFKVGGDVDAVSRATITITSAARAIRNSARRVARQLLTPPSQPLQPDR